MPFVSGAVKTAVRSAVLDPGDYVGGGSAPLQAVPVPGAGVAQGLVGNASNTVNASTLAMTLTAPIPAGESLLMGLSWQIGAGRDISVSDTKGNTYHLGNNVLRGATVASMSIMGKMTTALAIGDVVTVTWLLPGTTTPQGVTSRRMFGLRVPGLKDVDPTDNQVTNTSATSSQMDQPITATCVYGPSLYHTVWSTTASGSSATPDNPDATLYYSGIQSSWGILNKGYGHTQEVGGGTNTSTGTKACIGTPWLLETQLVTDTGGGPSSDNTPDLYGKTYDDEVMGLGPSNYWRMDEASGAAVADSVGAVNGNIIGLGVKLSRTGTPVVAGAARAIHSEGGGNRSSAGVIVTPAPNVLGLPTAYTMTGWARTLGGTFRDLVSWRAGSGDAVTLSTNNGTFRLYTPGSSPTSGAAYNAGDLAFFALVFDGVDQIGMYINAVLRATATAVTPFVPNTALYFGTNYTDTSFEGDYANYALFPRALTDNEILSLYRRGLGNT